MSVKIVTGHVIDVLRSMASESVHCVVTSPPYYGLRDYGIEPQVWGGHQHCGHSWQLVENGKGVGFCVGCGAWRGSLGLEPTIDLYLDHMAEVCNEIRRVLRNDGTFWLNIGDSYAGGGRAEYAPDPKLPNRGGAHRNRSTASGGLKPKDLMLIPSRLAIRLQDDGWWVRSDIAWCKRAPMPESCTDRPTSAWEHVFLLTKSGDTTFWTHRDYAGSRTRPVPDYRWVDHNNDDTEIDVEPANWRTEPAAKISRLGGRGEQSHSINLGQNSHGRDHSGGVSVTPIQHHKRWSRINLWTAYDYFYDQEAVKEDGSESTLRIHSSKNVRPNGTGADWKQYHVGGGHSGLTNGNLRDGKRNIRNFWLLSPSPFPEAHFATFPPRIPEICIKAGTSERGVCPGCGAAWSRVVRRKPMVIDRSDRTHPMDRTRPSGTMLEPPEAETIGWHPTCSCNAGDPIPATVLDPFIGSGTTAVAAIPLLRHCIGIDINPKYTEMGQRRIDQKSGIFILMTEIMEQQPQAED